MFTNFAGKFVYKNVNESLFFGFEEQVFRGEKYHLATKAKALFDYLYLKNDLHVRNFKKLKHQLFHELNIQWANFSEKDYKQFDRYVWDSNVKKMMTVLRAIEDYFEGKKFDLWVKNLLIG